MSNPMVIGGKKVLVTGAGSGIGLATAYELARRGALPILADINQEALEYELSAITSAGFEARACKVDVTDFEAVTALASDLETEGLSPDILVNCAGLTLISHVSALQHHDWVRIINVNVMGTIHTIEAFLPGMLYRGYGHIINIGSIDGIIPVPGQAAYCASKFAITGLTEVLYFDLKDCGIGVTLVCPGAVNTPMAFDMPIRDFPLDFKGAGLVRKFARVVSNSPQRIARHIADAVVYDRFLVIPGIPSRMIYHFRRLFPKSANSMGVLTARVFAWIRRRKPVTV